MKQVVPELRSIPLTFLDAWCGYGTDKGWVQTEDGDLEKVFLHPCKWKRLCNCCPRHYL